MKKTPEFDESLQGYIKELEDSETRFRTLFEKTAEPCLLLKDAVFIDCNPAACTYLGYPDKTGIVGRSPEELSPLHQPDLQASGTKAALMIRQAEEKGFLLFEWQHTRADGSIVDVEVMLTPLSVRGEIIHYVMWRDLTERNIAQAKLIESEERYRLVMQYSTDITLILDRNGMISYISPAIEKSTGYTPDELRVLFTTHIHPDDIPKTIEAVSRAIAAPDIAHTLRFRHRIKSGGYAIFEAIGQSFLNKSAIQGLIVNIRNITEMVRAEEALENSEREYRLLFENNPVPMLIYAKKDLRMLNINDAFTKHYGYTKEDIKTLSLTDLYPDEEKQIIRDLVMTLHGYAYVSEKHHIRKDGSVFPVVAYSHDFNFQGIDSRIAVLTDITEMKMAEQEIIRAKEAAEVSNRLKDGFISNISHEIRTPLNGILGMANIVREMIGDNLREQTSQYFESIDASSKRIIRTVDMILNYSRIRLGDFKLEPEYINLPALIENTIIDFRYRATVQKIDLRFVNEAGTQRVFADEYCLAQVLHHLLDNALKYTSAGFVEVKLLVTPEQKLNLEVTDTGIGISADYMERIFHPYSQEEMGYSRPYEGIGLGLSLVKELLDLMEATISVTSTKGKGSCFTISMSMFDQEGNVVPHLKHGVTGSLVVGGDEKVVLIVEDDDINAMLLETIVTKQYAVKSAANATDALKILESRRIDLILMDISLKRGMNGLELTNVIRQDDRFRHIPVIAVTGHAFYADRKRALESGCNDFLAKPFSSRSLMEKVTQFINS